MGMNVVTRPLSLLQQPYYVVVPIPVLISSELNPAVLMTLSAQQRGRLTMA